MIDLCCTLLLLPAGASVLAAASAAESAAPSAATMVETRGAVVMTKHTTLARCLERDRDGDTEGINTGDEAVDNDAT